jgi:hypothetical protein
MIKRCYTKPNKFSYIPSPAGEGGDEENLNKNLLGLVLPVQEFVDTEELTQSESKAASPIGYLWAMLMARISEILPLVSLNVAVRWRLLPLLLR